VFAFLILYLSLAGVPTGVPVTGFGYVGGTPAVEIGQEYMPDEGDGDLMRIPFDQMIVGDYPVSADPGVADAPALSAVVKSIYYDMQHRMTTTDPLGNRLSQDATAHVKIAQIQPDLKQVTLFVDYTDEKGDKLEFSKFKFIHRDGEH
jgi:hypothetical protein